MHHWLTSGDSLTSLKYQCSRLSPWYKAWLLWSLGQMEEKTNNNKILRTDICIKVILCVSTSQLAKNLFAKVVLQWEMLGHSRPINKRTQGIMEKDRGVSSFGSSWGCIVKAV